MLLPNWVSALGIVGKIHTILALLVLHLGKFLVKLTLVLHSSADETEMWKPVKQKQYIWIFCLHTTTKINIQCLRNSSEKVRNPKENIYHKPGKLVLSREVITYRKYTPQNQPHPLEEEKKPETIHSGRPHSERLKLNYHPEITENPKQH